MKIRHNIPIISAFLLSIAFSASPRIAPNYFELISGKEHFSGGDLGNYLVASGSSQDESLFEKYKIEIPASGPQSVGLGTFLYGYTVSCVRPDGTSSVIAQNQARDLQANINNYIAVAGLDPSCVDMEVMTTAPKGAVRLITHDSPVFFGSSVTVEKVKWLTEFFTVAIPIFLAGLFFITLLIYSLTNVFGSNTEETFIKYGLWAYSAYFIFQSGLLSKLTINGFTNIISSKLGTSTAVFAMAMIVGVIVRNGSVLARRNHLIRHVILGSAVILASCSFIFESHRWLLIGSYALTGVMLSLAGLYRKKIAPLLFGVVLILDSVKIIGFATPFMSRTSWFFVSFTLLLDAVFRLYGLSKIFSFFRDADGISNSGASVTENLNRFELLLKRTFGFQFSNLAVIGFGSDQVVYSSEEASNGNSSQYGLAGINLSFSVGGQYFVSGSFGGAPLFNSELPSSKTLRNAFESEITARTPGIISAILNQAVREFEKDLELCRDSFEFGKHSAATGLNEFVKLVAQRLNLRVVVGNYDSVTHQVKVTAIAGFPERVEERWRKGFLQAKPDNRYGPLARGVHDRVAYIVPDVNLIAPYLHENTIHFYKEANTISCFGVPLIGNADDIVNGVVYVESSTRTFDEIYRPLIEKFGRVIGDARERCLVGADLEKATTTLSRFIPRTHVFALLNGSKVVEKDTGYLMMLDLKGSTKFSLKHGSDEWLERVERLQLIIRPLIESAGMTLQTFSWDAAFVTSSCASQSDTELFKIHTLASQLGNIIERWAKDDSYLNGFWGGEGEQKARFCLTFGDTSRGLALGTTETWTVTGESMAVIAKMESECKTLDGVFFADESAITSPSFSDYQNAGRKIRGVDKEILVRFRTWKSFLEFQPSTLKKAS